MEEIRGVAAVQYAEREGILFNVDEVYLLRAESELRGKTSTIHDIQEVFYKELGRDYDPTDLLPGGRSFDLLVGRYGDGWVYVPFRGKNPEGEEREALRLLRRPLRQKEPCCGGDLLDLATRYVPELRGTGFPQEADLNLLFHAALRLAGRGELETVTDPEALMKGASKSYGNRRFYVPADVEFSLTRLLCDRCSDEFGDSSASLHRECAERLRRALEAERIK